MIDALERLKLVREHLGLSQHEMSKRLSLGLNTWQRYELEGKLPKPETLTVLVGMGFSANWLLTGEGTMLTADERAAPAAPAEAAVPLDEDLLAAIADGIARVYKEENARLSEGDKGRLIARTYNDLVAAYDDPDGRKAGLPMALLQLRRDLRTTPTATDQGKRLA